MHSNVEHEALIFPLCKRGHEHQMTGTRYRQEFGKPLEDGEDDDMQSSQSNILILMLRTVLHLIVTIRGDDQRQLWQAGRQHCPWKVPGI